MPEDVSAVLDVVGITAVLVPGLDVEVSFYPDHGVALVRDGLSESDVRSVVDWVLAAAASLLKA